MKMEIPNKNGYQLINNDKQNRSDVDELNESMDSNQIKRIKKDDENIVHKNPFKNININSALKISKRFGQSNYEKIFRISFAQLLITSLILYIYMFSFKKFLVYCFFSTVLLDLALLIQNAYFLYKLNEDLIFSKISLKSESIYESLNLANSLSKFSILLLSLFLIDKITIIYGLLLSAKVIIEVYFAFISIRYFVFSQLATQLSEKVNSLWIHIKYYLLCIDDREFESQQNQNESNKSEYSSNI